MASKAESTPAASRSCSKAGSRGAVENVRTGTWAPGEDDRRTPRDGRRPRAQAGRARCRLRPRLPITSTRREGEPAAHRQPQGARAKKAGLDAVVQALRLGQRRERLERLVLDLPDPLAGDAEGAPHLVERSRPTTMRRLLVLLPLDQLDRAIEQVGV